MVGAVVVVLHAPEDKNVTSIDELLFYALQPGKQQRAETEETTEYSYGNRLYDLLCFGIDYQLGNDLLGGSKIWST